MERAKVFHVAGSAAAGTGLPVSASSFGLLACFLFSVHLQTWMNGIYISHKEFCSQWMSRTQHLNFQQLQLSYSRLPEGKKKTTKIPKFPEVSPRQLKKPRAVHIHRHSQISAIWPDCTRRPGNKRDGKYTISKLCCWCCPQLSKCLLRFSNTDGEDRDRDRER